MSDEDFKEFCKVFLVLEKIAAKKISAASGLTEDGKSREEIVAAIHAMIRCLAATEETYPEHFEVAQNFYKTYARIKKESA
jgi:hypothetical protein